MWTRRVPSREDATILAIFYFLNSFQVYHSLPFSLGVENMAILYDVKTFLLNKPTSYIYKKYFLFFVHVKYFHPWYFLLQFTFIGHIAPSGFGKLYRNGSWNSGKNQLKIVLFFWIVINYTYFNNNRKRKRVAETSASLQFQTPTIFQASSSGLPHREIF